MPNNYSKGNYLKITLETLSQYIKFMQDILQKLLAQQSVAFKKR